MSEVLRTVDGAWAVRLSYGGQVLRVVRCDSRAHAQELGDEFRDFIASMEAYSRSTGTEGIWSLPLE